MDLFKLVGTIAVSNEEANQAIKNTTDKAKDLGKELEDAGTSAETMSGKINENSKFGTASVFMGSMLANMATHATTLATNLAKAGIGFASEMEQNIGGVETLFGDAAGTVFENADKAYKTAGVSANDYMQTITSFAAALKQSVETEEEAARIADMAIIDMSDNANKMGTDMASIQNAYQGFAKQNFTMLDNLKLGYGGTQEEMQRLLADAGKLSGQEYDMSNLSDIFNAIHVIQEEMGITGTTAEEASTTLAGSAASAKAAWDNFLSDTMLAVIPKLTEVINKIMTFMEENPETIEKFADAIRSFASISFDLMLNAFQWLVDNGEAVGIVLATIAAGLAAGAIAVHPYAAAIMAVVAGLSMLKGRSEDLQSGEIFDKYSEEDLALMQKWVDAQKEVYNAKVEGAQNGIAAEDNASLQEAIALANQYHNEIQKVDGLMHDYTDYSRKQGGDINKGIIIDVPAQVSDDSEANMQADLDSMEFDSYVQMYTDGNGIQSYLDSAGFSAYVNMLPNYGASTSGVDGSHASGLDFVPRDGYLARLHYGEAVLTRAQADAFRNGNMSGDTSRLEAMFSQMVDLMRQFVSSGHGSQQIVLDSGVLVGQLAPALDTQLGTISSRKGRRN